MVRDSFYVFDLKNGIIAILLSLLFTTEFAYGQVETYNVFYRIYFRDKGTNDINDFSPGDLLSEKAIERRTKADIPVPDFRDLPVYSGYINQISSAGFTLHSYSKWMNTALFKTSGLQDISYLKSLPFVSEVKIVKNSSEKGLTSDKLGFETIEENLPPYDQPIVMLNGQNVHNSGFNGKGILIAVLDGGFENTDNITSLEGLRNRNGIKGTYDFVRNSRNVYDYHTHGTAVLSILAGNIAGAIEGSARDADYLLLRTEDTGSEFPVEEDYWITAAEFADSVGADIISSSLGYYSFDDPLLDYKYAEMDGNTTFITRGADIAASKGILVINSAGNERNKNWIHIIAPSDGDSVVAVGAVEWDRTISSFSSAGPSYDRRIKPDLAAQGVSVPIQTKTTVVERSSGTSFSCPVISGMCACIMQAVPQATNYDIISALYVSSDRYSLPDSLYGYGIPDVVEVVSQLQDKLVSQTDKGSIISPNPFSNELRITFREAPGGLTVELFDIRGKLLLRTEYSSYISRTLILDEMWNYNDGVYIVRLGTQGGTFIHKVIKISN
jgi:serine protease AprX